MTAATLSWREALSALTAAGQPFELVETTIGDRTVRAFANAPTSLRELIERARSDQPFLVYEDERLTFEDEEVKLVCTL